MFSLRGARLHISTQRGSQTEDIHSVCFRKHIFLMSFFFFFLNDDCLYKNYYTTLLYCSCQDSFYFPIVVKWREEVRCLISYNSTAVVLRIALSRTKPRHLVCGCAAFVLPSVRRVCLCESAPKCASSKLTLGSCPLKDTVMFS